MCQAIDGTKHLPCPVLIQPQTVFRPGPNASSIDEHAKDVIVGKAVRRREVFPAESRHVLTRGQGCGEEQCEGRKPDSRFHSVFRYSMRSFNSSLVRSLLTP